MYYEDEGKISLNGTPMKRLVLALYAQYRVSAEFEGYVDDRNGIRQPAHILVETYFRDCNCKLRFRLEPTLWLKLWVE